MKFSCKFLTLESQRKFTQVFSQHIAPLLCNLLSHCRRFLNSVLQSQSLKVWHVKEIRSDLNKLQSPADFPSESALKKMKALKRSLVDFTGAFWSGLHQTPQVTKSSSDLRKLQVWKLWLTSQSGPACLCINTSSCFRPVRFMNVRGDEKATRRFPKF